MFLNLPFTNLRKVTRRSSTPAVIYKIKIRNFRFTDFSEDKLC